MKKLVAYFLTLLFMFSFLEGKTKMADVTGDGVDDEIKIGEQSVVVVNGATGNRYIVVAGEEFLRGVKIDNYLRTTSAKEIGVEINPIAGVGFFTEMYAFKNNKFVKISERLPGEISIDIILPRFSPDMLIKQTTIDIIDMASNIIGYYSHLWEGGIVNVPCPIKEKDGLLVLLPIKKEIEKTIVIEASTAREITIDLSKNTLAISVAAVKEKDVIISLKDEDGAVISKRKIDAEVSFIGSRYAYKDEAITLTIDNSYSVMTPKNVYYIINQYEYILPKKEMDAAIRNNMHTVQLAAEDYATQNEGIYPRAVSNFLHLLPSSFVNPVNPDVSPVVNGIKGKPGQICYVYDPKTEEYKIYGFDTDGKRFSLILSP